MHTKAQVQWLRCIVFQFTFFIVAKVANPFSCRSKCRFLNSACCVSSKQIMLVACWNLALFFCCCCHSCYPKMTPKTMFRAHHLNDTNKNKNSSENDISLSHLNRIQSINARRVDRSIHHILPNNTLNYRSFGANKLQAVRSIDTEPSGYLKSVSVDAIAILRVRDTVFTIWCFMCILCVACQNQSSDCNCLF